MESSIDPNIALNFNRSFVAQFAKFDHARYLITGRDSLTKDMTWAPYDLEKNTEEKISFRRHRQT